MHPGLPGGLLFYKLTLRSVTGNQPGPRQRTTAVPAPISAERLTPTDLIDPQTGVPILYTRDGVPLSPSGTLAPAVGEDAHYLTGLAKRGKVLGVKVGSEYWCVPASVQQYLANGKPRPGGVPKAARNRRHSAVSDANSE